MLERVLEPRRSFRVQADTTARIAEIGPRVRPRLRPTAPGPSAATTGLAWKDVALVSAVALVLGFTQGARIAMAGSEAQTPAGIPAAAPPAGELELDAIRGPMWRPAGSIAERPASALRPVLWQPARSNVRLSGPLGERAVQREPAQPPLGRR